MACKVELENTELRERIAVLEHEKTELTEKICELLADKKD